MLGASNLGLHDAGCAQAVGWSCSRLSWRIHSQDGSFTPLVTGSLWPLLAVGGRPQLLTTCASQWRRLSVLTTWLPALPGSSAAESERGGHSDFHSLLLEATVTSSTVISSSLLLEATVTSATFCSLETRDKIQSVFKGREIGLHQRCTEWLVSAF